MMWNSVKNDMNKFAAQQFKAALEAKKRQEEANKPEVVIKALLERCIQKNNMSENEIMMYALMYRDLAPEDLEGKISCRRMKSFLNQMEAEHPVDVARVRSYYNVDTPLPEKKMRKLNNFVQTFWTRCRTVENCMKYSHSFYYMAKRIARKLDAPEDMGVVERTKWLRVWLFLIKDQSFFWFDVNKGMVNPKSSEKFDKNLFLNPEIMVVLEKSNFSRVPDGTILLDMLKAFISLYPEDIQKAVLRFGELDGRNEPDDLRAGYVRQSLKKKLFPVLWVSGLEFFLTRIGMETSNAALMEQAVKAYKNKSFNELPIFQKEATDAYDHFITKTFNCYEISTEMTDEVIDGEQIQNVFAVTSKQELEMYVEVYKWLLRHPDFKFGAEEEKKSLEEYGISDLLAEAPTLDEMLSIWAVEMELAFSEEDVNLECILKLINPEKEVYEELFEKYISGDVDGKEVFEKIGFVSDIQAKICCSKKVKLVATEADKMASALKRIKRFGKKASSKSDIIYLEIFKYYMSNRKEDLPKNTVKLYGNVF